MSNEEQVAENEEDSTRGRRLLDSMGKTIIVVEACDALEASRNFESSHVLMMPMVESIAKGFNKQIKDIIEVFEIEGELIEVNKEQIDRVRMSKIHFVHAVVTL